MSLPLVTDLQKIETAIDEAWEQYTVDYPNDLPTTVIDFKAILANVVRARQAIQSHIMFEESRNCDNGNCGKYQTYHNDDCEFNSVM